jgi:bifunctional non-homologous end joining protein LigD
MSLARYRKMRDFAKTREPAGKARQQRGHSYVIQKHDASHLHYDFRLELNGVLLSWAVPKGPSLDPRVKRLAMQTEDHPVEYGGFEGTIPKGSYGGGTVMVWDRGTWEPEGDAEESYRAGRLTFTLHGEKLKGSWHLVRTARGGEKKQSWLLFKATDDAARPGDTSLLEKHARSALTGRDLSEIAAGKGGKRSWKSNRQPDVESAPAAARVSKKARVASAEKSRAQVAESRAGRAHPKKNTNAKEIPGAVRAPPPRKIEAELATLVSEPPSGHEFVHEVKFDGYRVLAHVENGDVSLITRGGEDWTRRMPSLAAALQALGLESAILDGEFVALDEKGVSDFQLFQNSFSGKAEHPLAYYAFDLIYLDGFDLRGAPLLERKEALRAICKAEPKEPQIVRFSEHFAGSGAEFLARAKELGLEGIVSKRKDSSYRSGRGKDWQKSKSSARQEFVIVGYTDPGGSRAHLGALLLGVRKGARVSYCGRVGTGFNERSLAELAARLAPLAIDSPKLDHAPRGADARGVHWVEPKLVAEVAFTAITHDGLLRHPTFKGLREDKRASEVVLEQAQRVASRKRTKKTQTPAPNTSATLTHPDKVLYPELGLTKRDLAEYFAHVAEVMLPEVKDRPLTLLRCPEGRGKQCFFQKHPGESLAEGLRRVTVKSSDGTAEYAAIEDERGLLALVQMGVLEVHIWGALAGDSERPDRLVFDLDPAPDLKFSDVIRGARTVKALLEELRLESWVKTTGGKGLHVTVPITPEHGWDEVKAFCQRVAQEIVARDPEHYVATMSKAKRRGKIFVDYLRNSRGATFIAPYSPRAREGAGVAMPVEWADLSAKFKPESFTVKTVTKYLNGRKRDPFASMSKRKQKLPDWR